MSFEIYFDFMFANELSIGSTFYSKVSVSQQEVLQAIVLSVCSQMFVASYEVVENALIMKA